MRIFGIDPGLATLGFGVVEHDDAKPGKFEYTTCGVLTTEKDKDSAQRLAELYRDLSKLFGRYEPQIVAVEKLFFTSNAKTAMGVSEARGVALLVAAQHNVEIIECTPSQIKNAIVGYGNATKLQVQEMVKEILGLSTVPTPDDAADALAVAICTPQLRNTLEAIS